MIMSINKPPGYAINSVCRCLNSIWKRSYSNDKNESVSESKKYHKSDQSSMSEAKNIVPDKHSIALVLIDVINHLDFEGNEELIKVIKPIGERIAELKKAACSVNIPVPHVKYMVKMVETK